MKARVLQEQADLFEVGFGKRSDLIEWRRLVALLVEAAVLLLHRQYLVAINLFDQLAIIDAKIIVAAHVYRGDQDRVYGQVELAARAIILAFGVGFLARLVMALGLFDYVLNLALLLIRRLTVVIRRGNARCRRRDERRDQDYG